VSVAGETSQAHISMDIRRYPDSESLAKAAADQIAVLIASSIKEQNICHLALAGGTTPARTYEYLREKKIQWERVTFWFGDERCLPIGDSDRNDTMAREKLLDPLGISEEQIHPMQAELGAEEAAAHYCKVLASTKLDIVLLGMGEDGHTASLFPGNPALQSREPVVAVFNAPKPPQERVSLGGDIIRNAGSRLFLVAGESKQSALKSIADGDELPAAMVGKGIWFIDEAAAASVGL